jgi:hypothetical protein
LFSGLWPSANAFEDFEIEVGLYFGLEGYELVMPI